MKKGVGHAIFLISIIFILPFTEFAHAQSSTPIEGSWVTNGPVQAIVQTADSVFIGGLFTYVGPPTGSGVPVDTSTGEPFGSFARGNGTVEACVADGSGGWYIGGSFSEIGGFPRSNLAHVLPDGSVDPAWAPNPNGPVYDLALSGSILFVAGDFSSIGGHARDRIAALSAPTGAATLWNPGANGAVRVLLLSGSTLYTGGNFTNIGGEPRHHFGMFNRSSNPNATGVDPLGWGSMR